MLNSDYEVWENSLNNEDKEATAIVPVGATPNLDQWTGGYDFSAEVAYLPERIEWDKKAGGWKCESFESSYLEGRLMAVTTLWAKWSERVGQPEDMQVGVKPEGSGYDMGLRLIFECDDFLYYWDCFGITFKSAQSAVRRAQKQGGFFSFSGQKQISTRFGPFVIPTLEKLEGVE